MTQSLNKTRPTSPVNKLEDAIHLAKSGRKMEARDMLRRLVALQPVNQAAWLWLSALATNREEAEAALAQAHKINPAHPSLARAKQWLVKRFSGQPTTKATFVVETSSPPLTSPLPQKSKNLIRFFNSLAFGVVILAIIIGFIVLLVGLALEARATAQTKPYDRVGQNEAGEQTNPEHISPKYSLLLEEAWAEEDWTQVIAILEELHRLEPDSRPIKAQLSQVYLQKGLTLRRQGFIEKAHAYFERVLTLTPRQLQAQQELQLASDYLLGIQHYQAGQWQEAIVALEAVWAKDVDYVNIKDLLFSAYYNQGLAREAADDLWPAKMAFEAAMALRPDLSEPRLQLAEVEFALTPQTPVVTSEPGVPLEDRIILVGIAEQRMHVYEGDEQVFDFIVSTGEPGRDTAIGEFEILDKIDVAYASTWNLDMPYWMGIYWAGPLENGIHALPTVKHTGYTLWDGYLGQRVSYGCVILGMEDAATLYDWVEVGTKVKIVPNFADWKPEDR